MSMCAVLGFQTNSPKEEHLEKILKLWDQSKIRGLHAFGFTVLKNGDLLTYKTTDFEELKKAIKQFWPFEKMIGHCRYSTSGDWKDPNNNQPIFQGDVSLVFNGVVSMKEKWEYEREFKKQYRTENDGEIVLRKFLDDENWSGFVINGKFSFAGIILDKYGMYVLRNENRPLWVATEDDAHFFGSTRDIFRRAGFQHSWKITAGVSCL